MNHNQAIDKCDPMMIGPRPTGAKLATKCSSG